MVYGAREVQLKSAAIMTGEEPWGVGEVEEEKEEEMECCSSTWRPAS